MEKIKTEEEIILENGFTNDMLIPVHLVKMLMNKFYQQFNISSLEILEASTAHALLGEPQTLNRAFVRLHFEAGAKWMRDQIFKTDK